MTARILRGLPAREALVLTPAATRVLAGNVVVGLGYYGLAALGSVVELPGQAQVAWLPAGFAAAMLYLGDLRWFAGATIADLVLGTGVYPFHYQLLPTAEVWLETLGNTVEITLAAYLMRRLLGRGSRLDRPFDVAAMLASLVAGVTISALTGTTAVWLDQAMPPTGWWSEAYTWWLGDMSGGLLITPLILVWGQRPLPGELRFRWRLAGQVAGLLILVVGVSIAAFSPQYPLPYLVFPALLLAAALGLRGVTAALAFALAVAIGMTAARSQPFAQQSITSEVLSTQLYILTATLTTLTLGAAISGRRKADAELTQARQRAADQAEQERQRIARDLHDSVSQTLFSLGLHTGIAKHEAARAELPPGSALPTAIAEVAGLAQAALLEMRASIFDLRGDAVAEQGLVTALAAHGAALRVRHDVTVTVTGPDSRLPLSPRAEELLFRIGQEAVTNAVKHSGCPAVCASVSSGDGQVTLAVHDQGAGFEPGLSYAGHLGLSLMRARTEDAGGTLDIVSVPGSGTTVRVSVPAGSLRFRPTGRSSGRLATVPAGRPGPRGPPAARPGSGRTGPACAGCC